MIFKKLIYHYFCLLFCVVPVIAWAQNPEIEQLATQVIDGFNESDPDKINALLHSDIGLNVVFRRGVAPETITTRKIDFKRHIPEYLPYEGVDLKAPYTFQYTKNLPRFNCDDYSWPQSGLSISPKNSSDLLSLSTSFYEQEEERINFFRTLEKNSRVVIATDSEGISSLVFHLTEIDGKWYLTVLDRASDDCGA